VNPATEHVVGNGRYSKWAFSAQVAVERSVQGFAAAWAVANETANRVLPPNTRLVGVGSSSSNRRSITS